MIHGGDYTWKGIQEKTGTSGGDCIQTRTRIKGKYLNIWVHAEGTRHRRDFKEETNIEGTKYEKDAREKSKFERDYLLKEK